MPIRTIETTAGNYTLDWDGDLTPEVALREIRSGRAKKLDEEKTTAPQKPYGEGVGYDPRTGLPSTAGDFSRFGGNVKAASSMGLEAGVPAVGQAVGSPAGPVGAAIGGTLGGFIGSMAAQALEGKFSMGRTLANMGMGAVPGAPFIKGAAKTAETAAEQAAMKYFIKDTAKEVGINVAAEVIQKVVDDKRLPSALETAVAAGGAMLGKSSSRVLNQGKGEKMAKVLQSQKSPEADTVKMMLDRGFVLDPSEVNPNVLNNTAVTVAQVNKLRKDMSLHNQAVATNLAREELGKGPDFKFNELEMIELKKQIEAPYEELGKKHKIIAVAIDDWKQTNSERKDAIRAYSKDPTPEKRKVMIRAQEDYAAAEGLLDEAAQKYAGKDGLEILKKARQESAKWHAIDAALQGQGYGRGMIDQSVLASMWEAEQTGHHRLSGALADIAKQASAFPKVNKPFEETAAAGVMRPLMMTAVGSYGEVMGQKLGLPTGMGAAAGASMAALGDVPVRKAVMSQPWQRNMTSPNYYSQPDFLAQFARLATEAESRNYQKKYIKK